MNNFNIQITNNMLAAYFASRVTDLQTHKKKNKSLCEFDFIFDHYLINIPAENKLDMSSFKLIEHTLNANPDSITLTFASSEPNENLTKITKDALDNFCCFIKTIEKDEGHNNAPVEISVQ